MVYGGSAGHGGPPASQNSPSGDLGGPHTGPLDPSWGNFGWPAAHHGRRTHHTPYIRLYIIFPQTVFSCRGSYGVVEGPFNSLPPRRRLRPLIFIVNTNESETDLQKRIVK